MGKSIKLLHKKTENLLRAFVYILLIIYILFFVLYIFLQTVHLRESWYLWSNLFSNRLKQIEKMVDMKNPTIPYANYLNIDTEGNIKEASNNVFKDIKLNYTSGLFRKIYNLKPNHIAIIFFPDMVDGIQRVHFIKRYENNFIIYSFAPDEFFPRFSVSNTDLLLEVGGIVWYSTNPQYIGDSQKSRFITVRSGNVYILLNERIADLQDTNIAIIQNISLEIKTFMSSAFVLLIVLAVLTQRIRRINKDFIILKSEQLYLEGYINNLSEATLNQDNNMSGILDKSVSVYKNTLQLEENKELQFDENNQYKFLIKKFIGEIFLLIDVLKISNENLKHRLLKSISAISKITELNDFYTAGHQRRVQKLACAIALEMGMPEDTIDNISIGALIHDVGKINISFDILNKPGKITNFEYEFLKSHVTFGYDILKEFDFPSQILTIIYQHHERLDGSGYPQGLIGEQIIIESRILAVSDVVEAMSSDRPYRPALGIDIALEEIENNKGSKYDPMVVDTCIKLFREKNLILVDKRDK